MAPAARASNTPKSMSVRPPDERVRMGRAGAAMGKYLLERLLTWRTGYRTGTRSTSYAELCRTMWYRSSALVLTRRLLKSRNATKQGSATTVPNRMPRALPRVARDAAGIGASRPATLSADGALERAVDVHEDAGDGRAKQHERRDNHDGDQGNDQGILYEALATAAAARKHVHRSPPNTSNGSGAAFGLRHNVRGHRSAAV